jgi:hypothetical protein
MGMESQVMIKGARCGEEEQTWKEGKGENAVKHKQNSGQKGR